MAFTKNIVYTILITFGIVLLLVDICIYSKLGKDAWQQARYDYVPTIYNNIALTSGSRQIPPFIVLKSEVANAWWDGESITMTTGLIDILDNDDQIALILGHELSHAFQHHLDLADKQDSREMESNADKMGAMLMLRAGYDICEGRNSFLVFLRTFGEDPVTSSHPNDTYRYNQLSFPWCSQIGG